MQQTHSHFFSHFINAGTCGPGACDYAEIMQTLSKSPASKTTPPSAPAGATIPQTYCRFFDVNLFACRRVRFNSSNLSRHTPALPDFGLARILRGISEIHQLLREKQMKSILDRSFKYTPSTNTDVRKTFAKALREARLKAKQEEAEKPVVVDILKLKSR